MPLATDLLIEAAKGALVGGLVGWATNYLAVTMLFHPRREWRIGGIPLPLTPGLVVKNQARLADAIGQSVARDLLDSETLLQHLGSIDMAAPIHKVLLQERDRLLAADKPVVALMDADHRAALDRMRDAVADDLAERIGSLIAGHARRAEDPAQLLAALLGPSAHQPLRELLQAGHADRLAPWLADQLREGLAGAEGLRMLRQLADAALAAAADESSGELREALHTLVAPRLTALAETLQEGLAEYLASDDFAREAQQRTSSRLHILIVGKWPMAGMLISQRTINELLESRWGEISAEIQTFARREELRDRIAEQLVGAIDKLAAGLQSSLREDASRAEMADKLATAMQRALGRSGEDPLTPAVAGLLDQWMARTPMELLAGSGEAGRMMLGWVGRRAGEWATSDEGLAWLRKTIASFVDQLLAHQPASALADFIPEAEWERLAQALSRYFESRVRKLLPTLLREHVNVAAIVTARVAQFDAQRVEETIKRVSGRELAGIIRLGGVIGIIVGAVMQMVYYFLGST